jgi:tetratricopeptide (TPR) repeat protein
LAYGIAAAQTQDSSEALSAPVLRCGEKAQTLLAMGKVDEALVVLEGCVSEHPDSDWLQGLYGRALYMHGDIKEAEKHFRRALEIDPDNELAKKFIGEMRRTQDLLMDRELSQWIEIGKDKAADILVLIIGVWLGTLLTLFSQRIVISFKKTNFEKALRRKDFDMMTDILEELIYSARKPELRVNLNKMLSRMSQEEIEKIIIDYVDDQDAEAKLLFFFRKMLGKKGKD